MEKRNKMEELVNLEEVFNEVNAQILAGHGNILPALILKVRQADILVAAVKQLVALSPAMPYNKELLTEVKQLVREWEDTKEQIKDESQIKEEPAVEEKIANLTNSLNRLQNKHTAALAVKSDIDILEREITTLKLWKRPSFIVADTDHSRSSHLTGRRSWLSKDISAALEQEIKKALIEILTVKQAELKEEFDAFVVDTIVD